MGVCSSLCAVSVTFGWRLVVLDEALRSKNDIVLIRDNVLPRKQPPLPVNRLKKVRRSTTTAQAIVSNAYLSQSGLETIGRVSNLCSEPPRVRLALHFADVFGKVLGLISA